MTNISFCKRLTAALLCFMMVFFNTAPFVLASDISGVNPVQQGGHNVYNIEGQKFSGTTQFRQYDNFSLSEGDVANLIYTLGYDKFINLVNSQVNINGILNTMQNGNFYNGHAIFVSPGGVVIGASGILNVGALSLITPSQDVYNTFKEKYNADTLSDYVVGSDKYKELINDSRGTIAINGKILSRGDVNIYGKNINIKGTTSETDKTGIIAGIQNQNVVFNDYDAANTLFNTLVSNNIEDTTHFALQNGQIKIAAGNIKYKEKQYETEKEKPDSGTADNAVINIENARLGGSKIDIQAKSKRPDTYILANADEAISSKIDVKNSYISGEDVNVLAISEDLIARNTNLTVPTVFLWLFDSDANISTYFSDGVYDGFEGIRTSAIVNVIDSHINAVGNYTEQNPVGNISIASESISTVKFDTTDPITGALELSQFIPAIFYGYGTKTESKVNITRSDLKAKKDVKINAYSDNDLYAKIADEGFAGVTLKVTDAFSLAFLKTSAEADTQIIIDNSNIEGDNVSIQALATNTMDNRNILKSRIGRNDLANEVQGGSAITLGGILNATDIKSKIEIKNNSKITADKNVDIKAYNVNEVSNWSDSQVTDPLGYTKEWQEQNNWILKQFDRLGRAVTAYDQASTFTLRDFKDKFKDKYKNIYNQVYPEDKQILENANFEAGASTVWNFTNTANDVIINNSQIESRTKSIEVKAHTIDSTFNEADAYAEEDANWGGAFAFISNKQTNNAKVEIKGASKLTAKENVKVDSIVELPAQQGQLVIANKLPILKKKITLGLNFGFNANDDFGADFIADYDDEGPGETALPTAGVMGFYNNLAVGASAGDKASVSASVVYTDIINNSDINIIENSILTSTTKDVLLNSVVSASAHDAVDFFSYDGLIDELKSLTSFNKWNHQSGVGAGGAVLIQDFTNNARITIDNSKINAEAGTAEVNTAAEQSYLNLAAPGGKAETIGINGSVSVQRVHGTTSSTVKESSKINANKININSGKANVQLSQKGTDMSLDNASFVEDKKIVLANARDAKDHITAIAFDGNFMKQSGSSAGGAFGASVITQKIDRTVRSLVNNAVLTAETINVNADSYTRNIFVVLAGAFAGGVSTDRQVQENANNNNNNNNNGAQQMANAGNWMDIVDNAREDEEDVLGLQNLFNENNPNQQGAANAQQNRNNINNQNNAVDRDGNVNGGNGGNNPGNNNGNMADGVANPQNATKNFSLALAGSVSVVYDESSVASEIINSTLNVGQAANVAANRDHFMLNIDGGLAKAGNVGAGAAVDVFTDEGGAKASVDGSTILFTSDSAEKQVNVTAKDDHYILNIAAGVGASTGNNDNVKVAVGGTFNTNRLLGTTEAKITNNSVIKNDHVRDENGDIVDENTYHTNDIDVKTNAKGKTTIWNAGGAGIYTSSGNASTEVGASVAGNMDFLRQNIKSEISNATNWKNIKNVDIKSELVQDINSISVAGSIVNGAQSSYTINGALGLEFIGNNVTALLKDSTIDSSGNVKLLADSDIKGKTLTGDLSLIADEGVGVGIGAVIDIDNSTVSSTIDNSSILNSTEIESKANSADKRKFLAVNFGASRDAQTILANGVVNIYKTNVNSKVINNSSLKSSGAVDLLSKYENENQAITAVAAKTQTSLALGANILASYYGNNVTSELEKGSKITQSGSVKVDAATSELINYIPAAIAVASGGGSAVSADIAVNVIKNTTNAHVYDNITTTGILALRAIDDTTIYERGGVLGYASGTAGIAGTVYYDYLNKNINAEVKGNPEAITVSSGDMTVQATAENSFGGTKVNDQWDLSDISTNKNDYGANWEQGASFANWNMAYSLAHGDSASVSGAVIVRVIDDVVKANVENVTLTGTSLMISANDYTIMNTIAGQFSPGNVGVGGNAIIVVGNTDTQATLVNGTQTLTGDLNVMSNTKKDSRTVMIGGSGSGTVAVNGAAYVDVINDKTKSSIVGSTANAGSVLVDAIQKNTSLGVDLSVAGSGTASIGGILYLNLFNDTTEALIGDNSLSRTTVTANNNITVKSDSDYEMREYLVSVGASGSVAVSALAIANVIDSTVKAEVDNTDVTSTNGKLDVKAYRGLNKDKSDKTAFFRNWFKGTSAYTAQNTTITSGDLSAMAPLVGALNVAGSGVGSGAGSIIVNKTRGNLTSKIDHSKVSTSQGTNVLAQQDFVNFDTIASVAGAGVGAVNFAGVINSLEETVKAEASDVTVTNGSLKTDAKSNINFNQLVLAGQGAGTGASLGVVVDINDINDKVYSYVTNTTTSTNTQADAAHNIIINNILLAGGGVGTGVAAQAVPLINKFRGATVARINGSTINGGNITLNSHDFIDNLSAVVGVAAAGVGGNVAGYEVANVLSNSTSAYISNSTINTTGNVGIDTYSLIDSTNAIFSAGIIGTGATILANVIINDIHSYVSGFISNSEITKAGNVEITANIDNGNHTYRHDSITNTTGNVTFAATGAALSTNVIYNNYKNRVQTYIDNTSSEEVGSVTVKANSERRLDNTNIGIGGTAIGANVGVNAISTNIDTSTYSYIDAQSKTMDNVGAITLRSNDDTDLKNIMGNVRIAGLGAAAGVNLDMTTSNNIVKSEILSATNGQINAASVDIKSYNLLELDKTNVGVSLGAGGLAGDYVLIRTGKRTGTYDKSEQDSSLVAAINKVNSKYTPTATAADIETGSISRVNGNLKTTGNIAVNSESKIKGRGDNDKLRLSNVTVTAALGAGSVGVKEVNLASNTDASITGGTVQSTGGNISSNAKSTSNVDITNVEVSVSGINFSGGSAIYKNSSETTSKIKDATVKANNIDVNSESTSNSNVDATFVTVTGGTLAAVDLAENTDSNKSVALVTGNTNIDATGKLTLHSKANTDLSSKKQTVRVSGADFVRVSKNEVNSSTISRAIIENVNGTINTNGLDIITDYDKMNTLNKTNVVAVALGGITSVDKTGAFMNSSFKSGIDSPTGLILNNTGDTNIITARDNGTNGMVSKGEIYNVKVSLQDFAAVTTANAQNTAKSETVLNSNEFTTNNLNINSYLNSSAKAEATGTKVAVGISVNAVTAEAKDSATLDLKIAGNNTVLNDAVIRATNNADVSTELSAFNFSLLAGGGRSRLYSTLTANTTGDIGGNFNTKTATIDINSTRNSRISKSSGAGGIIAVNDSEAKNTLTGSSILTIDGLSTDKTKGINQWNIANRSTNTMDVVSSDGSGGLITVSASGAKSEFNTHTETIVENANINSQDDVGFNVENKGVIKDTATNSSGGFIAVNTQTVDNNYFSSAKLTIKDSKVESKNLELSAHSELKSPSDMLEYRGRSGGFVTVNSLNVTNTLNQSSEIDIQNSILHATNDAVIHALTSSEFKQKIDSRSGGFVTVPKAKTWLNSNNRNTVTLNSNSKILADSKLKIDFNTNSNIQTFSTAVSRNFAGEPSAYSYLTLVVNNMLNNNGSLQAGELVDIDFMNNSVNDLTQYAFAECHAAVAKTDERGLLTRTINNTLIVAANADITSGQNVNISYLTGTGHEGSTVAYKNVYYALFGIPIEKRGNKSQISNSHSKTLKLDGEIVAGAGNSKYIKIDRDGTVNMNESKGVYDKDYTLFDNTQADGATIKENTLASIDLQIENVTVQLNKVNSQIENTENIIAGIDSKINPIQTEVNNINTLISEGATYKNIQTENNNNEFFSIIDNDVKTASGISDQTYALIVQKYNAKLTEVQNTNAAISQHNSDPANVNNIQEFVQAPTIVEFLNSYTGDDIAADQKTAFITQYNAAYGDGENVGRLTSSSSGVSIYTDLNGNKYIGATKVVDDNNNVSWKEITDMNNQITAYQNEKAPYQTQLANYNETKANLTLQQSNLADERTSAAAKSDADYAKRNDLSLYSIAFNDIKAQNAVININGSDVNNGYIQGSGNFVIASAGLKVDNYSTRSLIFNAIDMGVTDANSGLQIGGKTYSEFLNKPQALNTSSAVAYKYNIPIIIQIFPTVKEVPTFASLPTAGAHYISRSSGQTAGVVINNYYDVNHPFASTFDIPHPTDLANVIFQGTTGTGDMSVWTESGSILFACDTVANSKLDLYTPNGSVMTFLHNNSNDDAFNVSADSNIYSGQGVHIIADAVDLKGNINIGYKNRSINITDNMLLAENLILDPTSGEKNLINLGGNAITPYLNDGVEYGNIKAIYKDNQIYLYNLPEINDGGIEILAVNNNIDLINSTGTISSNLNYVNGYSNIDIVNNTTKTLNIGDFANVNNAPNYKVAGLNVDNINKTETVISSATTNITSAGEVAVNGKLRHNVSISGLDYLFELNGALNITSNKGISIYEPSDGENIYSSVIAGGNITLTNTNAGNVLIDGNVENKGNFKIIQEDAGDVLLNTIITQEDGLVSVSNTNSGDILIDRQGAITSTKGNIEITNTGTSTIYQGGPLTAQDGEVIINNSRGAIYSYSNIIGTNSVEINNTSENLIIGTGGEGSEASDYQIIGTTSGNVYLSNINGNLVLRNNAVIVNLSENDGNVNNGINIVNVQASDAKAMYLDGYILNTASGDINILNYGQKEAVIAGEIVNTVGNISVYNANESLTLNGEMTADNGSITILNSGTDDLHFDLSSNIVAKNDITITNEDGGLLKVEGMITSKTGNISLTNSNTDVLIGEYATVNNNYITAEAGDVTINQTNGNLMNVLVDPVAAANHQNSDIGNPNQAYKTLISAKNDLIINIIDGNIGSAPDGAAIGTNASSREYTDSINVNVEGTITATAKNLNDDQIRVINLRSKESDMNIKKIDVDGDLLLTAADWKQADNVNGSDDPEYYIGYSISNAADAGDYAITAQNVSIISSNEIGAEDNKLTILQDKLGNEYSTLNTFAEKSIYFDGASNDPNNNLAIGTMRTKTADSVVGIELNSDANIDTIMTGGSINIKQKAKDLTINTISMYGNNDVPGYDNAEDILYPHDRLGATAGGNGRIVLKALDAYANGGSDSSIVVNEAYVLGLGSELSDVELKGDNIVFNAISKSGMSDNSVVFDIQGVSQDEVSTVANATRTDYKNAGGHYLASNADLNIETDSANNHGAILNTIYANKAEVKTNNTVLKVNEGFIDEYATFVNGNLNAAGYNHIAVVNNRTKAIVSPHYQMYTKRTGDFKMGMDGTIILTTDAPVVHYNPDLTVNGFHNENSFTRLTLKENIVQQTAKELYKTSPAPNAAAQKVPNVKLDTSNIISEEINNYAMSHSENEDSTEYKNLSTKEEENIGG